ncbi:MAG: aldose epimerase family protein [Glaciecola sp.]
MTNTHKQQAIQRVTLVNQHNMQVQVCDYGARILSIKVPNACGELIETTQNYAQDTDILADTAYMGATCGRIANRVSGAKFEVNNTHYHLDANEGNNTLHGGSVGFSHHYWKLVSHNNNTVVYEHLSPHLDQGFPGNLQVKVSYTLSDTNELLIQYHVSSDMTCPINMCNHTYFTLGETNGIHALQLQVNAKKYLPVNAHSIPTGEQSVVTQAMDFTAAQKLADKLQLRDFDDCYIVDQQDAVHLVSEQHQLSLTISSDHKAMQVYTGNYLPQKHSAIALEAQGLVDAVNQKTFEAEYVSPQRPYRKFIRYTFNAL